MGTFIFLNLLKSRLLLGCSFLKRVKIFILTNIHFKCFFTIRCHSVVANCHSATIKNYFRIFLSHKVLFEFKYNHFKYLYPYIHSHSNTFKMVNSFRPFQMEISKMLTMTVNNKLNWFIAKNLHVMPRWVDIGAVGLLFWNFYFKMVISKQLFANYRLFYH